MEIEAEDEERKDAQMMRGFEAGDESYLVAVALVNPKAWGDMWKAIIRSDTDRSGF